MDIAACESLINNLQTSLPTNQPTVSCIDYRFTLIICAIIIAVSIIIAAILIAYEFQPKKFYSLRIPT